MIFYNNTSPYKVKVTVSDLDEQNVYVLTHPPNLWSRLGPMQLLAFPNVETETGKAEVVTDPRPVKSCEFRVQSLVPVPVPECTSNVVKMDRTVCIARGG